MPAEFLVRVSQSENLFLIRVGVSISSSDGAKSLCFDEISGSWTYFCKSTMLRADCISGMFDIVVFTLLSVTPNYAATA